MHSPNQKIGYQITFEIEIQSRIIHRDQRTPQIGYLWQISMDIAIDHQKMNRNIHLEKLTEKWVLEITSIHQKINL